MSYRFQHTWWMSPSTRGEDQGPQLLRGTGVAGKDTQRGGGKAPPQQRIAQPKQDSQNIILHD